MQKIIDILVERDNISFAEAWEIVLKCKKEITDLASYGASMEDIEESLNYWLGLEPDYLMDIMEF